MLTAGKIRMLLALTIVGTVVGLVVVTLKRMPSTVQDSLPARSTAERQAELTLRGIRVSETADGSTRWNLVAEKAEYDTDRTLVSLADVRLTVAPIDKKLGELELVSPTATYNTETRNVFLSGGVKARSTTGMGFSSRTVRFLGTSGIVTTADPISFSDEGFSLQGTGMEFVVGSSQLKIKKNVTATVRGGKPQ